ncbi:hypothetical protein T12_8861 [Trichinella patagoniensis]|uniref:Uncharacterized protein n=1 Tax=Trichinella patagoniensis TaxID=990121 RepID=A0A0V0ZUR4_9BILA|nr:hypothetical protein T12_8861 [Trichinella patagoniensis]
MYMFDMLINKQFHRKLPSGCGINGLQSCHIAYLGGSQSSVNCDPHFKQKKMTLIFKINV